MPLLLSVFFLPHPFWKCSNSRFFSFKKHNVLISHLKVETVLTEVCWNYFTYFVSKASVLDDPVLVERLMKVMKETFPSGYELR